MDKRLIYREILLRRQFEEIAGLFSRARVPLSPVKGMGLILSGIYRSGERDMEDIDILVKPRDASSADSILRSSGYRQVRSGEKSYHRTGEPAVIDLHTEIIYLSRERLVSLWDAMSRSGEYFLMSPEEHFIYILVHALIHHGELRDTWKTDLDRLTPLTDLSLIRKKALIYGIPDLPAIYDDRLFSSEGRSLRTGYIRFILSLPGFPDKGHFLRPFAAGGFLSTGRFLKEFFFPDEDFLRRRYRVRPVPVMYYLRPLLLVFRAVKTPLFHLI